MTTQYPGGIDGYQNIRVLRDEIDEIVARDHNDLRSAVVKIEQTLGIQPQGVFGTVVARLDDAYQNIESHVAGDPPRHMDTVIESPARSGSPHFSLSAGTVGSQLAELLAYVNEPLYSGSGSKTFADGYALPASNLEQAITEIVRRLGVSTGGAAVGFSSSTSFADGSSPAGASLSAALNDAVSKLGAATGGLRIGASSFSTDRGTFSASGASLALQDREIADFSDELSHLAERSLYGFVVSGMAVSRASATSVNVGTGWVAVGGRILPFSASSFTHSGAGFHRIYAKVTSGAVTIADAASDDEFMGAAGNQATVPLATFTETGAAHSGFFDLRRYGMHVNNKPAITVGSDGYGADFTSLRSALEYVSLLRSAGAGAQAANRIVLTDDITVPSGDLPLQLASGLEIDGANHKISWGTDSPLFEGDDVSDVSLLDIRAEYTAGSLGSAASLADFSITGASDSERIRVVNCHAHSTTADRLPYFLRYDSGGAGGLFRTFVVEGCSAQCVVSALQGSSATSSPAPHQALVRGNRFHQSSFAAQPDACIRVGGSSLVENNIVEGGYNIGIDVHVGESAVVSGNLVNGGTGAASASGTPIMVTGINVRTTGAVSVRSLIADNIVKGTTTRGIQLRSTGSAGECVVSGNVIDNRWDPIATQTGIEAEGVLTQTLGNYILYPGLIGIQRATHAVGNIIIGSASLTPTSGILVESASIAKVVANNFIYNMAGVGIDAASAAECFISGNVLEGASAATTAGIASASIRSVIEGNVIRGYGSAAGSHAAISTVSGSVVVSGNSVGAIGANLNWGVSLAAANDYLVTGNLLFGGIPIGIEMNLSSDSTVSGNHIVGPGVAAAGDDGIRQVGSNCAVTSNTISGAADTGIDVGGSETLVAGNFLLDCQGFGIHNASGDSNLILGNQLENVNIAGVTNGCGIRLDSSSNYCMVSGNMMTSTAYPLVHALTSVNCVFSGNYVRGGENGIYLDTTCNRCSVIGNYIENDSDVGMQLNGPLMLVANNYVRGAAIEGINHTGAFSLVSGNLIDSSGSIGILMGSASCTASNNVFRTTASSALSIAGSSVACGNSILSVTTGDGIEVTAANSTVTGNYITNTANAIDVAAAGDECVISSNIIVNATLVGIESAGDFVSMVGNYMEGTTGDGINVTGTRNTITGNIINAPGAKGIDLTPTANEAVVSSNLIENPTTDGIQLSAPRCLLVGNKIRNCAEGISTSGAADDMSIVGNYVENHTGTAYELSSNDGALVIGNKSINPTGTALGINFGTMTDSLMIGNLCEGASTSAVFSVTGTTDATWTGNVAYGASGTPPSGFGSHVQTNNAYVT